MFGFRRSRPLELVPFAEARPRTFSTLLCDGVTAHNLPSFAELLALHARLQAERSGERVLASLDDLDQACYTSGHCTDVHQLDGVEEDHSDDEEVWDDPDQPVFADRLARLRQLAQGVDVAQAAGLLDWDSPDDAYDPVTVNQDPEAALLISRERQVLFQFVPVASAADAIAAFPNGYFRSDLNPMQNHAWARHLESKYGLALFGIGSRFLGFRRAWALDAGEAGALAAKIAAFYRGTPPAAAAELARLLTGRDWLLLRYTET